MQETRTTSVSGGEVAGIVFDVERFSVNDGPGIRTLVFLKGCPLRCDWCANPESQRKAPQLGFDPAKCEACDACVTVCPNGERFAATHEVPWSDCRNCLACVPLCPYGARTIYGRRMTAAEVVAVARRDRVFYRNSGGGVTLGGGEATMQPAFAEAILAGCRAEGLSTALETCGFTPWPPFERILRHVDVLLFDLKHMDGVAHRARTGVDNVLILENAVRAAAVVPEMVVRFPLIPDFNDGHDNLVAMGHFVRDRLPRVHTVEVLTYHSAGASKARRIGQAYRCPEDVTVAEAVVEDVRRTLGDHGLRVRIGG